MNKKNTIRKFICGLLALVMVVTCVNMESVEADYYSKKQLQSLQKKTKKNVKQYKSKWESEKKKYKKQTKGTTVILGDIVSGDPLIVYDTLKRTYYWITDSKNMVVGFTAASGYVKKTGQYKKYGDITCAVAKAVKVTANPAKYEEKYKKEKEKLTEIKNALKNSLSFNFEKCSNPISSGDTVTIHTDEESCINCNYKYKSSYSSFTCYYEDYYEEIECKGGSIYMTPRDDAEGVTTYIKIVDDVTGKKYNFTIVIDGPDDTCYDEIYD